MTPREAVQVIIDDLPDEAIEHVERLLEGYRRERVARILADAPVDDEELSAADIAAIERGRADARAGRVVAHEDVLRRVDELIRAKR